MFMRFVKTKLVIGLIALLLVAGFPLASIPAAQSANINPPDLPSPLCDNIEVQQGNRLAFRVYAVGVQVYRWNGTSWVFVEPVATLFADANYHVKVGSHYAGPTWESIVGGKIVGTRVDGCSPDPTAIPWLLLQAVSADGIFNSVTYIQRVNTKGGLMPTAPGTSVGAVAEVPYSTEYYFYRAKN